MAARPNFPPTKRGYDLREVVSALQKAVRRSNVDDALYWAYEMSKSGYANWCWKRLRVICSEDIGPAAPGLAADIRALYENWLEGEKANRSRGGGEEILYLTHAVIAVASAPKSRITDWAVWHHNNDFVPRREIPDEAYDKHVLKGKRMGRGDQHFFDEATLLESFADQDQAESIREAFDCDPLEAERLATLNRLAEIEDEYRERARRFIGKDPDQPHNPWDAPVANEQGELL